MISRYVTEDCAAGDPTAAAERTEFLGGLSLLDTPDAVDGLAAKLVGDLALPPSARLDALHIAVAAVSRVDFLLTWNCKHIANPSTRPRIERACRDFGSEPPVICTPQELLESHRV